MQSHVVSCVFGCSFCLHAPLAASCTALLRTHQLQHLAQHPPPHTHTDILFVGLIGRCLGLLRIWGLLIFAIRSATAATARARARAWQLQTCAFGPRIPDQTVIMLLGLVFSCIQ